MSNMGPVGYLGFPSCPKLLYAGFPHFVLAAEAERGDCQGHGRQPPIANASWIRGVTASLLVRCGEALCVCTGRNPILVVAFWGAAVHGRQRAEEAVAALYTGVQSGSRLAMLAAAEPGSLSGIWVQRAEEVDKLDKKIAYYCRLYAVSQVRFIILAGAIYLAFKTTPWLVATGCVLVLSKM